LCYVEAAGRGAGEEEEERRRNDGTGEGTRKMALGLLMVRQQELG
jgi:hypothetical protein